MKTFLLVASFALLVIDWFVFKHIQTIYKFNRRTLFFLLPFTLLTAWMYLNDLLGLGETLTFAGLLLVVLFYLLNKTDSDFSIHTEIHQTNIYNQNNARNINVLFGAGDARTGKIHLIKYITEPYKNNLAHIIKQNGEDSGNTYLNLIRLMESSNNLLNLMIEMNVDGLKSGGSKGFYRNCSTSVYNNSDEIYNLIEQSRI